jgi:hypothetical protein
LQSMLLSKALKMQQDSEDKKHEVIIENFESKIKEQSVAIEKKDFELQTTEGLLAEAEDKITELNSKLLSQLENFEQEKLKLHAKLEAEVQKSSELKKSLTSLQNKCLPGAFEHIEGEIDDLDEVIAEHGDFCALVASRGTAVAFLKSGCEHGKVINRPNFSLSPVDLDNIPNLARSIANRFIKLVWTKGGRSKVGDEAQSHLKSVTKSYLMLTFSFEFEFRL